MDHFLLGCKVALQAGDMKDGRRMAPAHGGDQQLISTGFKEKEKEGLDFHIILGNEACDLDSMISAITLAYFLTKTSSNKNLVYVPVLNIPQEDFPLRTECSLFLRENGIAEDHLTFRDQIDLADLYKSGKLSLTLVDHNVLPRLDLLMEDVVTEVIDHHVLERTPSSNCWVTAELVGSCATLITEKIIHEKPEILDFQLASLLRGTIILDCVNMAPVAGKVTPKDTEYVTILESKFPHLPTRDSVFDLLQNAKFDVSGLTTNQMLRKDLKTLMGCDISMAISAVYMHIEEFLQRDCLQRDLQGFCKNYSYNVVVTMAISYTSDCEPIRQIAVYSQQEDLRLLVSRTLEQATSPSLDLSPISCQSCNHVTVYHQGNTGASRKKVLPILNDFLKKRDLGASSSIPMQALQDTQHFNRQFGFKEQNVDNDLDGNYFTGDDGYQADSLDESKGKGSGADLRKHMEDGLDKDNSFPPTPMNSLVEGCPLDRGLPKLTTEAILERISRITTVDSEVNLMPGGQ